MRINSPEELQKMQDFYGQELNAERKRILVCAGTGCVAGGSLQIYARLKELMKERGIPCEVFLHDEADGPLHTEPADIPSGSASSESGQSPEGGQTADAGQAPEDAPSVGLKKSGCHGFCEMGPLLRIDPEGLLYIKVKVEDCEEIIERSILKDEIVERLVYQDQSLKSYPRQEDIPFYKKQTRVALEYCGHIDAESIREYIAVGGYSAVKKALFDMTPQQIVDEISDACLRGRGGGGFPTGRKWAQVLRQKEEIKYVVCNGDEGDPGAFMDRSMMEGEPHRVLEGMMIAGIATGAHYGYIYVRAEYPLAVSRLQNAIDQAMEVGLLGENILGSGFDFTIKISQGAGAFVCGEGSALTSSIEGNRGMPRVKPPRTVEKGLFEKPTVLNNVETFCNVAPIILKGADWYKTMGPENNHGTKAFALTGNVNSFKAVQIGGPSGGCLCISATEDHLDLHLDFDSLKKVGAMIGSGGLVVMNDKSCMVEVARFFMNFTQNESCGKCVPCREGTKRMLELLTDITEGRGTMKHLDMLQELADTISDTALCGLGKTAAFPVVSTMKYFRDEYIAHVVDKKCPAGQCKALVNFSIDPALCKGCTKCARLCPVSAISGELKQPHTIDVSKCIKCGACKDGCPFHAIS